MVGDDPVLPRTLRQESLSKVYVRAVAAAAGYDVATTEFDMEGIDLTVVAGGHMRPRLDIQLKATTTLPLSIGPIQFPLKRRNYDLLREPSLTPRILVVLDLPSNEDDWLSIEPNALIMRKCAFWANLRSYPSTTNTDSVTISLNTGRRFDVEGLRGLMEQARKGAIT